jgi:DNA-binding NtrC family response regulator
MARKTILIITDNHKTEASVREVLGKRYDFEVARDSRQAAAQLAKRSPDLIIIDFDLKGEDGLRLFRNLGTSVKTIMLSASGSIPLAVSAAKLGVEEFLRKPMNAEQLRASVEKNISREPLKLCWKEGLEWLRGGSPSLQKMLGSIQDILGENRDVILVGEQGIPKDRVAEFIHSNSPRRAKRFVKVDVASFRRESFETHFWAAVQEIMSLPGVDSVQSEEDRCGTLYLENVENLDDHFKLSILDFFKERKGKIDKGISAIIGVCNKSAIQENGYVLIEIPPLRERKEDIPYLLELYLKRSSIKYGKEVKFVPTEILDFLVTYDFPGNYQELERLVEGAVLAAASDKLELENFPFDFRGLLQTSLRKALRENLTLEEAKRRFEKGLFHMLLKKSGGESSRVARFLDIPKTVLAERLEDLLD